MGTCKRGTLRNNLRVLYGFRAVQNTDGDMVDSLHAVRLTSRAIRLCALSVNFCAGLARLQTVCTSTGDSCSEERAVLQPQSGRPRFVSKPP